jgi:hypothetical protein
MFSALFVARFLFWAVMPPRVPLFGASGRNWSRLPVSIIELMLSEQWSAIMSMSSCLPDHTMRFGAYDHATELDLRIRRRMDFTPELRY